MSNSTELTIFSDLHLEHSRTQLQPRGVGPVCLLGDLCAGRGEETVIDWLERQPWAHERPIILIPGNHDFEALNIEDAVYDLKILARPFGWHVLHNEVLTLGDVRIFGSPWYPGFDGWKNFPELGEIGPINEVTEEEALEWLQREFTNGAMRLMDLRICKDDNKLWTVPQLARRHREAKQALESMLSTPFEGKNVVLTHWGPTAYTKGVYPHKPANLYYQNQDEDVLEQVHAWFHGHQHHTAWYHYGSDPEKGWVGTNARGVSPTFGLSPNGHFLSQGLYWTPSKGMDFDGVLESPDVWEPKSTVHFKKKRSFAWLNHD